MTTRDWLTDLAVCECLSIASTVDLHYFAAKARDGWRPAVERVLELEAAIRKHRDLELTTQELYAVLEGEAQ